MSIDIVNREQTTKQDITWDELILASESEIEAHREKLANLRKSLVFFKKQKEMGVPFPLEKEHVDIKKAPKQGAKSVTRL